MNGIGMGDPRPDSAKSAASKLGLVIRCQRRPQNVSRSAIKGHPALSNERIENSGAGGIGWIDCKLCLQLHLLD
jgi:hypothetical protein